MRGLSEYQGVIENLSGIIRDEKKRFLFIRFIEGVTSLSGNMRVEFTRFSIRFAQPEGIRMGISPYRDLFLVTVGERIKHEMRVSDRDGFLIAMDMVVRNFLREIRTEIKK